MPTLVKLMGHTFTELADKEAFVVQIIAEEVSKLDVCYDLCEISIILSILFRTGNLLRENSG